MGRRTITRSSHRQGLGRRGKNTSTLVPWMSRDRNAKVLHYICRHGSSHMSRQAQPRFATNQRVSDSNEVLRQGSCEPGCCHSASSCRGQGLEVDLPWTKRYPSVFEYAYVDVAGATTPRAFVLFMNSISQDMLSRLGRYQKSSMNKRRAC